MISAGRAFYKMTGSGNDFVVFDARTEPPGDLARPAIVKAVCAHGTGVGADGVVFLFASDRAALRMVYLNSDGSVAALCGNATLCTARLALELGAAREGEEFAIETESGLVRARFRDGLPEIDLAPADDLQDCFDVAPGAEERRIGFALVGVPHLVVLSSDVDAIDVVSRGRELRHHPGLARGANVNFVSPTPAGGWHIRTYERGVEAETLACGTGAVATALLLHAWGAAPENILLETRSGRSLRVRHRVVADQRMPSLSGEARAVFVGRLAELPTIASTST